MSADVSNHYELVRGFEMMGGWGGLTVCRKCGAAIYLDPSMRHPAEPSLDVQAVHEAFHERVDPW